MQKDLGISIIVPTRNRAEALEKYFIKSILNQEYFEEKCEIIIVDSSDNDETENLVASINDKKINSSFDIKYVRADKPGIVYQRKAGFEISRYH
ncbi:MAG TPA: glycosyltransferase, partial [Clostridia bacterium]